MTLAPIELATGIVFGGTPASLGATPLPPAEALQAAIRPAFERGAVSVSFSGGKDSSAVLAAATAVARREGLPDPIPLTIRARGVPSALESDWQEQVVRHLGLADWTRVEIDEELDVVGPYARQAMVRHGLLWPFNAHFHMPLLERAQGGTLLTGVGGDELWGTATALPVRRRRRALALAPFALRRAVLARREPLDFPWLTAEGRAVSRRLAAAESAGAPFSAPQRMAYSRGMRYTAVGTSALDLLAADAGAAIAHPLLDRGLWAALARAAGRTGFVERGSALRAVVGALLPPDVLQRRTKAGFDALFFNAHARAAADAWDGSGVPTKYVDGVRLRAQWAGEEPDPHSLTLLQAAWLVSSSERVEQSVRRGAE